MRRLVLTILISTSTVLTSYGQDDFLLRVNKVLPSDKQWTDLSGQHNSVPTSWLMKIEIELDSTISATDCYKFIYNTDSTKFIAFFIMHKDDPKFDRLIHFGRTVHWHYRPSDENSLEFLSYILWGMKYEQNWYYHKDYEDEFWNKSENSGKSDFLFYVLSDIGFLKATNPESFWKQGGKTKIFRVIPENSSYLKEYVGLPEIVGWHKTFQKRRQNDLLNEKTEIAACLLESILWDRLHQADSNVFHKRYISKYSGKSCLILYNSDRNQILLPFLYYDNNKQPWVSYYFIKISNSDTTLYQWKKFPPKQIDRKPGDESLEVVYNIRTFIENWTWGTVNMISNEKFWADNFNDTDLKIVKE